MLARRRRVHAVVAGARRGFVPVGRGRDTRRRRCPGSGPRSPICTRRAPSASTGARLPATARRGAYLGATLHDYNDRDDAFGFRMVEYEGIAHVPILRETWVLSFHGRVQHAAEKDGQQIPFFMLPALGGGSSLRGYSSWRFRDQNSLLLQAEWRIMVNRYLDLAFFYDAGKVAARTSDLDFDGAEGRLRLRPPLPRPVHDAAARRAGQEPRKQFLASSSRRLPRSRDSFMLDFNALYRVHAASRSSPCPPAPSGSSPPPRRHSARASILTIRSRASRNRRTPRRPRRTISRRCTS